MDDLIARLERATGPDRELDVAIVYALHPNIGPYQPHCVGEEPIFWHDPYRKRRAPQFTSSIDTALTLVPDQHSWEMDCWPTGAAKFHASVGGGAKMGMSNVNPAIALCIAALKARVAARYAAGEPQQAERKA